MKIATGQSQKITFNKQDTLDKLSSIKGQDEVIDELTTVLAHDSRGLFPRTRPLTFLSQVKVVLANSSYQDSCS